MSKADGQRIVIKFTEDIVGDIAGNEVAFIVTGKEQMHVGGELLDKSYQVASIDKRDLQAIVLTTDPLSRFNNVEGNLKVSYNSTEGNLRGWGDPVENFEVSFLPTGLVQKLNPHTQDNIQVYVSEVELNLIEVLYKDLSPENENVYVSITDVTSDLILVEDIPV